MHCLRYTNFFLSTHCLRFIQKWKICRNSWLEHYYSHYDNSLFIKHDRDLWHEHWSQKHKNDFIVYFTDPGFVFICDWLPDAPGTASNLLLVQQYYYTCHTQTNWWCRHGIICSNWNLVLVHHNFRINPLRQSPRKSKAFFANEDDKHVRVVDIKFAGYSSR